MNKARHRKLPKMPFELKVTLMPIFRRLIKQEQSFTDHIEEQETDLYLEGIQLRGNKLYLHLEGKSFWREERVVVKGEIELTEKELERIHELCRSSDICLK
jgi:hypothetical protein